MKKTLKKSPKKTRTTALAISALAIALALAACKKEERQAPAEKTTPAAKVVATLDAVMAVMAPYEECRARLAADQSDVADCARAVAAAASASKGVASMDEIAAAASALASAAADDIEKLRVDFGEVSKPVQAMLAAVPGAAAKFHVYECPMAKGYNRWAQAIASAESDKLSNPYMGSRMIDCGTEVDIAKEKVE